MHRQIVTAISRNPTCWSTFLFETLIWFYLSNGHDEQTSIKTEVKYRMRLAKWRINDDTNSLSGSKSYQNILWMKFLVRQNSFICTFFRLLVEDPVWFSLTAFFNSLCRGESIVRGKSGCQWQFHLRPTIFGESKFVYKRGVSSIESSHCYQRLTGHEWPWHFKLLVFHYIR